PGWGGLASHGRSHPNRRRRGFGPRWFATRALRPARDRAGGHRMVGSGDDGRSSRIMAGIRSGVARGSPKRHLPGVGGRRTGEDPRRRGTGPGHHPGFAGPRSGGTAVNEFVERDVKLVWRELKDAYDVVIIGGGGHGLSTAYHLASRHGNSYVAVLERGYVGSGNTGRNTTRSE